MRQTWVHKVAWQKSSELSDYANRRLREVRSELFMNNGLSNSLHVKGVITDVHHALAHVDCLGQERHIAWNSLHCHAAFIITSKESVWLPIRGIICNNMASPCLDSQPGTWKGQLISLNVLHGHIILQPGPAPADICAGGCPGPALLWPILK